MADTDKSNYLQCKSMLKGDILKLLDCAVAENNKSDILQILDECETGLKTLLVNEGMFMSTAQGKVDTMQLFLDLGANIHYRNPGGESVFKQAKDEAVIQFLIQNGVDINRKYINGQSEIMVMMTCKQLQLETFLNIIDKIKDLNEIDVRTGGNFLHIAAYYDDEDCETVMENVIKFLISKGLDVNAKDNNGDSPLHIMALSCSLTGMRCLLESRSDVIAGIKNLNGENPLHYLTSCTEKENFVKCLELLLYNGLNINECDMNGKTVIHHALDSKSTSPNGIEELKNHGAKLNVKDKQGCNEVFYAVDTMDIHFEVDDQILRSKVIEYLVQSGVSINEPNINGVTALHIATYHDSLDILVTLIDCGADVGYKSNTGATPLHWSCKHYNMLHVLLHIYHERDLDINVTDNFGSSVLHWSAWHRNILAVQTLLQVGIDASIKDCNGQSALELARSLNFQSEFEDLLENEAYKDTEFLSLQSGELKCQHRDPVKPCQLLRYIKKQNGKLQFNNYKEHVQKHSKQLALNVQRCLKLQNMGMYYDINENHSLPKVIDALFNIISTNISKRNPIFHCKLTLTGSMFEGTKVGFPDEFDYVWQLVEFESDFTPEKSLLHSHNFVHLKLKDKDKCVRKYRKYLTSDFYLDSQLLFQDFYQSINTEITEVLQMHSEHFQNIYLLRKLNVINCSISNMSLQYFGCSAKCVVINVDVVIGFYFKFWDNVDLSGFPGSDNARILQEIGINGKNSLPCVIAKHPDRYRVQSFTTYFLVSYSNMERTILKNIPLEIKNGYILLKNFIETQYIPLIIDHDKNRRIEQLITSYHLKNCLLQEVMQQSSLLQNVSAQNNKLENSFFWAYKALDRFQKCIDAKFFPTFLNPQKNLIGVIGIKDGMINADIYDEILSLFRHVLDISYSQIFVHSN